MKRYLNIQNQYLDKHYQFISSLGLIRQCGRRVKELPNEKKDRLMEFINNPFLIETNRETSPILKSKNEYPLRCRLYARLLVWSSRCFYPLLYMLSHLNLNWFDDAREATLAFIAIIGKKNQKELCLSRAIFGATTSKAFKQSGIMIVGMFMPLKKLHAWVIENNRMADPFDTGWIMYKPISAMI